MRVLCPGRLTKTKLLVSHCSQTSQELVSDDYIITLVSVFMSELYTLLLEDILVLMQKQDERLILRCHSKNLAGTADTKHIFSPIIKLSTVLVRSVATGERLPSHLSNPLPTHIWRMNPYRFPLFPQITDHFLWSPCPKMELRSMSWWPKQCPSRECKFWPLLSFWCFCKPRLYRL